MLFEEIYECSVCAIYRQSTRGWREMRERRYVASVYRRWQQALVIACVVRRKHEQRVREEWKKAGGNRR